MLSYFQNVREEIRRELKVFFDRKAEEFERVNALGQDLCARLYEFSAQGKMIRGGLVSLAYSLFRGDGEQSAVREKLVAAGAAMELFQSGLLVHDDIMDRDPVRRGLASLYHQYVEMADGKGIAESAHLGESLGICAGDVAFFLAFEILSGIDDYYVDRSGEPGSVLTSLVIALADPKPRDTEVIDELPRYKGLHQRYHRWGDVVAVCQTLALRLGGAA